MGTFAQSLSQPLLNTTSSLHIPPRCKQKQWTSYLTELKHCLLLIFIRFEHIIIIYLQGIKPDRTQGDQTILPLTVITKDFISRFIIVINPNVSTTRRASLCFHPYSSKVIFIKKHKIYFSASKQCATHASHCFYILSGCDTEKKEPRVLFYVVS